jgi:hypothetical protein
VAKPRKKSKITKKYTYLLIGLLVVVLAIIISVAKTGSKQEAQKTEPTTNSKPPSYVGERLRLKTPFLRTWSIVIPSGWQIERQDFEQGLIFADKLTYDPHAGTVYTNEAADRDIARFNVNAGDPSFFPKEYSKYQKTSFSSDTLSGSRYFYQFPAGQKIGNYIMTGGEKDYTYYFVKDDVDVTISYFVLNGDKDQHELVEEIVRTLHYEPSSQ